MSFLDDMTRMDDGTIVLDGVSANQRCGRLPCMPLVLEQTEVACEFINRVTPNNIRTNLD